MKFEIYLTTFLFLTEKQHCFEQSKPDQTSSSTMTSVLNEIPNEETNGRSGISPEPIGASFRIERSCLKAHEINEGDVPK